MSESNGYAKANDIFGKCGVRQYTDVETHGMKFRLRTIDAAEHETYVRETRSEGGEYTSAVRLIVLCVVGADDKPMFAPEDFPRLRELEASFIQDLAELCLQHSGLETGEKK